MKIFFDQGTPAPLRRALNEHTVSTAYEIGWGELDNGRLLEAVEAEFDVLVTTDKNLRHQQRLAGRRLAILFLPTTNWPELRARQSEIAAAISALRPGDIVEIELR
jgi:predicted nuclease of predicted toxin-antitoxin system